MPNREQNQGPTLPPPLQSKTQTVSLDQASESQTFDIPVPPLDRQISKVAKFIVSRWKLKKDAAQHQRLDETVAGTPHQFANLQLQTQPLQDDYTDPEMSTAASDSPPLKPQESTDEPPEPFEQVEPSAVQQEAPVQQLGSEEVEQSVHHEVNAPSPNMNEAQPSNVLKGTVKHVDLEVTLTPEPSLSQQQASESTENVTSSSTQQVAPAQTSELPEDTEASGSQMEAPVQPTEPPEEVKPPVEQEATIEAPESPMESTAPTPPSQEVTVQPPAQDQADQNILPSITGKPVHLQLSITVQPITEDELSPAMQETPVQLTEPPMEVVPQSPVQQEMTVPIPGQDEVPYPTSPSVTFQPSDLELTITTETTTGADLSPVMQETSTQPPEPPEHPEVTLPHPVQNQAQHPNLNEVTVQPLALGVPLTSESKQSTTLKKTTAPPPKVEVTLPQVTVKTLKLELTKSSQPTTEVKRSSMQETSTQPPKPAAETKIQPSTSGQDQAQRPTLAVTEANNTITPPPQHPEVTPPHSEQLQSGLERTTIAHSVNPTTESALTVQTEPNATPYTNICELCTCRDESLLCVGLSPTQKLRRVPVPKPNTYKKVLTTLNFHGNAIDYIDKNTWKAYRWTEKLILSENRLTELRKDSFEGLLSLEYLDLSCNKIQYIERGTFESLPFLKFVNLGCNLITELNFGTFQAWHGMQFLHQV